MLITEEPKYTFQFQFLFHSALDQVQEWKSHLTHHLRGMFSFGTFDCQKSSMHQTRTYAFQ